ncbi:hypothetical protein OIU84_022856 [Salix udensis]|uniref:Uncharacterized protein n=1 Tax=Salix udensis TaxID=889485 RepID=A0AAD6KPI4_9ROSI|nr:hypothetical protein OIU84_022856 [Salix udensis]
METTMKTQTTVTMETTATTMKIKRMNWQGFGDLVKTRMRTEKDAMAALNQEVMQLGQSLYNQPGAAPGGEAGPSDSSSKGPDGDKVGNHVDYVAGGGDGNGGADADGVCLGCCYGGADGDGGCLGFCYGGGRKNSVAFWRSNFWRGASREAQGGMVCIDRGKSKTGSCTNHTPHNAALVHRDPWELIFLSQQDLEGNKKKARSYGVPSLS